MRFMRRLPAGWGCASQALRLRRAGRAGGLICATFGPSGSGRNTLLSIVGLFERATCGSYRIHAAETSGASGADRTLQRRTTLGFVFRFQPLLPAFDALKNVTLPA